MKLFAQVMLVWCAVSIPASLVLGQLMARAGARTAPVRVRDGRTGR